VTNKHVPVKIHARSATRSFTRSRRRYGTDCENTGFKGCKAATYIACHRAAARAEGGSRAAWQLPRCSSHVPWRLRLFGRFARITCAGCGESLRADTNRAAVVLYVLLSALIYLAVFWSAHIGCLPPLLVFLAVWACGEITVALMSPLERTE
jgi:uncharacterized protein (DUF983 family)